MPTIVAIADREEILRREGRGIEILVAREEVTITHARYPAGERVAGAHVHHDHTDAFYVLEGELTFEVGREKEGFSVSAGGFVAAPPKLAHAFRTSGDGTARWLTIHARDGGFGAFMRGIRDGAEVEWDISGVPADGGLPASEAIVSLAGSGEQLGIADQPCRLRCVLPDISVVEWHDRVPQPGRPPVDRDSPVDSLFVIEGELEAMLSGTRRNVGPGTLVSGPRCGHDALSRHGSQPARVLGLHTPDGGFADHLRRISR